MSPDAWPMHVAAVMAGPRTRRVWPGFPDAAQPEQGRLGHGAGSDQATAVLRATGEMIEIASCCAWGDEPMVRASIAEVGNDGWPPSLLSGFSDVQRRDRDGWNRKLDGLDWIPPEANLSRPIDWLTATCLHSGDPILVPADCVLIGRHHVGDADAVAVADTSGCAAGKTPENARLSALFELIERDATGRWWYGVCKARALGTDAAPVDQPILAHMHKRGRALQLLDITTDLGIPTVAAVGSDLDGKNVALGIATRGDLAGAVLASVTELMQMELRIAFARTSEAHDPGLQAWFADVTFGDLGSGQDPVCGGVSLDELPAVKTVDQCVSRLAANGCRVALVDCSRDDFGIPVVRAISPDLCHWKPRFGRSRLAGTVGAAGSDGRPLLRI